ncbi:antitoxin VapB family protein [Natrinema halophilum]|uniref:Antitoxin n=1 Tax=Natrinema halophilum TaxID=1699371 RepID=A0A7D5KWI9_9EURY|nr:antitoxin VapB family protein [Natrinema halophilum]QLG47562.1 antitoxin VapB family protein [Natrinema halophilum]
MDETIRVSESVTRKLDRYRRDGESYDDAIERLLEEKTAGAFDDGFGRWSNEEADSVREARRNSKEMRNRRIRERVEDDTQNTRT